MSVRSVCAAMFLLVSCLGGMRGYEVVWTDLGALRYDLQYCEDCRVLASGGSLQGEGRSGGLFYGSYSWGDEVGHPFLRVDAPIRYQDGQGRILRGLGL